MILKELTGYFGGHWKLLVSPQWVGFTFFFFAADTQTWKLFSLPFWIMLDIHGQSFYLKKPLICWFFCIRYHNQHMSEVPPVECPAQLFILCPGSPLCLQLVHSHLCRWLLGTMQGAEHAPRHCSVSQVCSYNRRTHRFHNPCPNGRIILICHG